MNNNNTTTIISMDDDECSNQIGYYISLGINALLGLTTIVSEVMGSNEKSDKNGILDTILKVAKGYKVVKRKEEGEGDEETAAV